MIDYLGNMIMKPLRAPFPVDVIEVAVVVAGHVLEHTEHSSGVNFREERPDKRLMYETRKICHVKCQTVSDTAHQDSASLLGFPADASCTRSA